MITTRELTEDDIPDVINLVKEFYAESIEEYGLSMNVEIACLIAPSFIHTSFGLESDGKLIGLLCGTVAKLPLSNETVYQEAVWFVSKEYRRHGLKLYYKLEEYCKGKLINKIVMVSMSNSKPGKLNTFYNRLGFKVLETHYIKTI